MLIGELLIEQGKLDRAGLGRALADKPPDERLCSYLIAQGIISFDDAAKALGAQRSLPCALTKHLDGRDPDLATLIPAELGRASCVLPIGKTTKGALIVCARDPSVAVMSQLKKSISCDILLVIAPAGRLEQLVKAAYGTPTNEFDIDVDDQPAPVRHRRPLSTPPMPLPRASTPPPLPPTPDMDALDPESVRFALTDLDDVRVAKDPTQTGPLAKTALPLSTLPRPSTPPPTSTSPLAEHARDRTASTPPPLVEPSRTVSAPNQFPRAGTPPLAAPRPEPTPVLSASERSAPRTRNPSASSGEYSIVKKDVRATRPMSLQAMAVGLEHADTREAATDAVLAYIATRWNAGLVLAIRDKVAVGYRGHRVSSPESITVSLGSPSTVQRAVQTRAMSMDAPAGVGQAALVHALDGAASPTAAPVLVAGEPVAVLAVGDPVDGPHDRDAAATDLKVLADALGAAYARIHGG